MDSHALILFGNQLRYRAVAGFLAATRRENLTLGALLAGMVGLGLGLFVVVERTILRPVSQLHGAAVRVAAGETDVRLVSAREDELGQLANAFDHMLDQIQETTVSRERLEAEVIERRQAEESASLAQARFQRLVDANAVGVIIATAAGDILEANDYYLGLLACTRADLAGGRVDWRGFTPPEWLFADEQALVELTARGVCTPYEKEYVRADGSRVAVLITDTLMPGPEQHILGLILDITERRRAEAEVKRLNADLEERVRQRTAELRAANGELESFAYAVSHDLRAPLRALSGFSQALIEDYSERLEGEARVFLEQIDSASRRMGALIDGILTLSRSTRGELRRDPVDLSRLARRLLTEHAHAEPGRQVDWMVEPEMCALGDPTMLEVVMRNLIDNAWKYTSKTPAADHPGRGRGRPGRTSRPALVLRGRQRGRIRYGLRRAPVQTLPAPAPTGRISGHGDRARHRPADRASPRGRDRSQGHGGRRRPVSFDPTRTGHLSGGIMNERAVLIVEDNPQDEMLMLRALRKVDLANRIDVVRDGQQALDYLFVQGDFAAHPATHPAGLPAVVLLDIGLPRLSGLQVLERLRADPRTHLLPVVILTSSDEERDRMMSYENGANSFVRKPLEFAELAETVARLGVYWLLVNEPPTT